MKVIAIPVGSLGTNCYLLCADNGDCAVIDPGANAPKLQAHIEENSLTPRCVLLTHGHYDHIGAVRGLLDAYPEMTLYVSANDLEMLTDGGKSYGNAPGVEQRHAQAAHTVREGDTIALDSLTIHVLDTPGHTRGGVTYRCEQSLFVGDTLFRLDCGRTDLYGGDYPTILRSLAKLAALSGDYDVYSGHGPESTLAFERANNPYMQEGMGKA